MHEKTQPSTLMIKYMNVGGDINRRVGAGVGRTVRVQQDARAGPVCEKKRGVAEPGDL